MGSQKRRKRLDRTQRLAVNLLLRVLPTALCWLLAFELSSPLVGWALDTPPEMAYILTVVSQLIFSLAILWIIWGLTAYLAKPIIGWTHLWSKPWKLASDYSEDFRVSLAGCSALAVVLLAALVMRLVD